MAQNLSYLYTALGNPGLAVYDSKVNYYEANRRYCSICKISVDQSTTYHCSYCDVCIVDHDHHCPWTSKCIGGKTIISFYIFVVTTFFLYICLFIAAVVSLKILK